MSFNSFPPNIFEQFRTALFHFWGSMKLKNLCKAVGLRVNEEDGIVQELC